MCHKQTFGDGSFLWLDHLPVGFNGLAKLLGFARLGTDQHAQVLGELAMPRVQLNSNHIRDSTAQGSLSC
jgi:hypothetical protein